jgi:hypothetical protein
MTLNTRLYPDSANTYDSLGDAYLAAGDKAAALTAAQQTLAASRPRHAGQRRSEEVAPHRRRRENPRAQRPRSFANIRSYFEMITSHR